MKGFIALIVLIFVIGCGGNQRSKVVEINGVKSKTIPGLSAADIHLNFKNKGFITTKKIGAEFSSWNCTLSRGLDTYLVIAGGKGPEEIVSVDVNYKYLGDRTNDGELFVGYAASLPYTGSNPQGAKDWVLRNIKQSTDTSIGDVKYRLLVSQYSISLKMFVE